MATDQVSIFNLALSAAGVTELVSSPTEDSPEARTCALWFDVVVEKALRAAPWPSAKKLRRLATISEADPSRSWQSGDPEPGWRFAYAYPTDLIRPRYLVGYHPFTTGLTGSSRSILTNLEDAILVYTNNNKNIASWDPSLRMAIIYALAAAITMPLTSKLERVRSNYELANQYVFEARTEAANQNNNQLESLPDWIVARGYTQGQTAHYIYPHGPVFSMSDFSVNG